MVNCLPALGFGNEAPKSGKLGGWRDAIGFAYKPTLLPAFMAHADIVEPLLSAGADKSIRNAGGLTALGVVTPPFEDLRNIYDLVGAALAPYGLKMDYERIEARRPRIAEMLRWELQLSVVSSQSSVFSFQ